MKPSRSSRAHRNNIYNADVIKRVVLHGVNDATSGPRNKVTRRSMLMQQDAAGTFVCDHADFVGWRKNKGHGRVMIMVELFLIN